MIEEWIKYEAEKIILRQLENKKYTTYNIRHLLVGMPLEQKRMHGLQGQSWTATLTQQIDLLTNSSHTMERSFLKIPALMYHKRYIHQNCKASFSCMNISRKHW